MARISMPLLYENVELAQRHVDLTDHQVEALMYAMSKAYRGERCPTEKIDFFKSLGKEETKIEIRVIDNNPKRPLAE